MESFHCVLQNWQLNTNNEQVLGIKQFELFTEIYNEWKNYRKKKLIYISRDL